MYIVQFQDGFINKTIKYAGIAGATLLALSPMITPIFTITNTVKADVVAPDKTTAENLAKGNGEVVSKDQVAQASQNIKIGGESSGDVLLQKIIVTPKPSSNSNTGNGNTSISGIVTTHTDKGSYSLYNDDNQKVDNRALVKSSSWKVDGTRTVGGVK